MTNLYGLPAAEYEIMNFLWNSSVLLNTSELLLHLNAGGRNWKRQTLHTLIVRLERKGLIRREGKLVHPAVTEDEYKKLLGQEFLNNLYGGKVNQFISALLKDRNSDVDIASLERMIDTLKNGD